MRHDERQVVLVVLVHVVESIAKGGADSARLGCVGLRR